MAELGLFGWQFGSAIDVLQMANVMLILPFCMF